MANVSTWNMSYKAGHDNGMQDKKTAETMAMGAAHKGGRITKTGPYRLKKGEYVLNIPQTKAMFSKKAQNKKVAVKKRTTSKS